MKNTKFSLKILFFIFTLLSSALAQPSWVWQNPLPTGNNLNSVYFFDANTGFAGGASGVLLRTTNGGANWQSISTGTTEPLNSIYFVNSSTGFIAAGFNTRLILKTTDGGLSWSQQNQGTPYGLKSVHFANTTTGMVAGNLGFLYRTTNAGTNWNIVSTPVSFLQSVYMASESVVYAVGSGDIIKSTNGGLNWSTQTSGTTNSLYGVYFIDTLTGFAVGGNGTLLKTTNGGTNWSAYNTGYTHAFYSVRFAGASTGYICGQGGMYLTTTNAGVNWSVNYAAPANNNDLSSIFPVSPVSAYSTGKYGTIIKTTNGGSVWSGLFNGVNMNMISASFVDDNTIYANSFSKMIKTSNGGANWEILSGIPSTRATHFINANTGYVTSYSSSTVYKTTNGGANWSTLTSGLPYSYFTAVYFINQNTGLLIASTSQILRTTNGGVNWNTADSTGNGVFIKACFVDTVNGYAAGYKYSPSASLIKKTTNAGLNWTELTINTTSQINAVQFLNLNTGYAVTNAGQIYKTTNAGSSWETGALISSSIYDICFVNENSGYAAGINGGLYRTTNSGQNFTQLSVPAQNTINRINFNNSTGIAYLIGDGGMILKSTNGAITGLSQTGSNEPVKYSLLENFPNPFNPSTTIKYALPSDAKVNLVVYDITGKEAAVLLDGINKKAGVHEEEFNASGLSSGVYFYRLEYDNKQFTAKMVLVK